MLPYGMVSSIHVISQEEVVRVWNITSNSEQLNQVVKLTMDVAADGHGTTEGLNVGFFQK